MTLAMIVPFARKMNQATRHCLKFINLTSVEGGRERVKKKVVFSLRLEW